MSSPSIRVLHLGLGRFHRAHQAVYFQRLRESGAADYGISAFSMRSADERDQMKAAGLRYDVIEIGGGEQYTRSIDVIREVGFALEDRELLLSRFANPETEIVSLTVTEKGYSLNIDGELDLTRPEIQTDLASPLSPTSTIGFVALGLKRRLSTSHRKPLTILSCDNLRENGRKLERAVHSYLQQLQWNEVLNSMPGLVTFPMTMVDRIVPAWSADSKLPKDTICTETFSQWVIEDRFAGPRPALERVGVQFSSDVHRFEEMKLKLLNASHSLLAYAGLNRGLQFVHEAVQNQELRKQVEELIENEAGPLIANLTPAEIATYKNAILARFNNPGLPHRLEQIAMDGSKKIPERILSSLVVSEEKKSKQAALLFTVQEWIRFVWERLKPQSTRPLEDPQRELLIRLWTPDLAGFTTAVLSEASLVGTNISSLVYKFS